MKKYLLLLIFVICLLPFNGWSASYYGCGAGAINGDATWCAVGDVTNGVCAKDSGDYVSGATALAGTHTLYANGCTITIPSGTFTAAKLSTKGDGSKGAGGGFTIAENGVTATVDASVEGGTTDCLTIGSTTNTITANILTTNGGGTITTDATASADGIVISGSNTIYTIGKSGSPVAVTGGGAANYAINDTSTTETQTIYANITGGASASSYGLFSGGASGTINITGDITGATGAGLRVDVGATINITGNCTGGSNVAGYGCTNTGSSSVMTVAGNCTAGSVDVTGCSSSNSLTGYTTVTGNIIGTATNMGARGKINWSPADTTPPSNYIKIWTGGTDFYYMTANPEPAVADVKSGVTYGWDGSAVYTGTLATGGGGASAW